MSLLSYRPLPGRRPVGARIALFLGFLAVFAAAAPDLDRVVLLEFDDMAALKRFYHSEDYAPLIKLRQEASTGDVALVEGTAAPG